MSRESLGHFELLVLLALIRHGEEAYGVPIARAIEDSTGKPAILASVYNTLERLEEKGLVRSRFGEPRPERGGRAQTVFCRNRCGLARGEGREESPHGAVAGNTCPRGDEP
jgi:DNA-binding PadR family transcriptional regulator